VSSGTDPKCFAVDLEGRFPNAQMLRDRTNTDGFSVGQLYLFGRPQDYGWAHAEPISVVRSRNHLRFESAFQINGETLWVGAATHDIGFERDERNNGVTHKIDPDIDSSVTTSRKPLFQPASSQKSRISSPKNP